MGIKVTKRASNIEYAIRDVIPHTTQLVKDGKKIYYLNIGDPAAFDFTVPPHVKAALCKALDEDYNFYSPSEGLLELREAVAKKEKRVNNVDITADDVLVTEGISEGIQMSLAAIVERGDEILFPDQLTHLTFLTRNSLMARQSPTKPLNRKAGNPMSMTYGRKFPKKLEPL